LLIGKITPTMAVFAALVLAGAVVTSVVLEEGGSPASGLAAGEASFGNSDVISCISRTWCVDLGFAVNGLTENVFWSWDGHRWSQMRNAASCQRPVRGIHWWPRKVPTPLDAFARRSRFFG
jgi:hypothetical protein